MATVAFMARSRFPRKPNPSDVSLIGGRWSHVDNVPAFVGIMQASRGMQ